MEDKLDKLLDEIKGIKDSLKPETKSWLDMTFHSLEKLVVPVLIGVLAWFGSQAGTKISDTGVPVKEPGSIHGPV